MFLYQTTCLKKNILNLVRFDEIGQKLHHICFYTTYWPPFGSVCIARFQTVFTNASSLKKIIYCLMLLILYDFIIFFLKIFSFLRYHAINLRKLDWF